MIEQLYTVITENDESAWSDDTGNLYHYPKRYLKYLTPGTKVIYYKGRLKDIRYSSSRLSNLPHYFGVAEIGDCYSDNQSNKDDYYSIIVNYHKFDKAVIAKIDNAYIEVIPVNRKNNYWRDGVRLINKEIYNKIVDLAGVSINSKRIDYDYNQYIPQSNSANDFLEGGQSYRTINHYERDSRSRIEAIKMHGYSCMACGFNFYDTYGEQGRGFIHVHHVVPLYKGENKINPQTDLIVVCPNCHYMIHRKKEKILSLEELKKMIKK